MTPEEKEQYLRDLEKDGLRVVHEVKKGGKDFFNDVPAKESTEQEPA